MEDEYLIQPVEETRMTIFDSAIDLGTDVSEICIDMLQDEGIVKDIPREASEMFQFIKYEDKREVFGFKVHSFSAFDKIKKMR